MNSRVFSRLAPFAVISLAVVAMAVWLGSRATAPNVEQERLAFQAQIAAAPSGTDSAPLKLIANPEGFMQAGIEAADLQRGGAVKPALPVIPTFPKSFANPLRLRSGVADVCAMPLLARDATGTIAADGSLVYADAFEGCDISYRCEALKTEEIITVKGAVSAASWSWELDTGGLTPRLTSMHTIELVDADKIPRLRINAPEGKDAAGKLLRVNEGLTLALEGTRVTLRAGLSGCKFPVTIDSSWTSTGIMAVERYAHTSTLLGNGMVLVAGGHGQSSILNSSEIYDPETGTWSATAGALGNARENQTATLLGNGTVLVSGGKSAGGLMSASSELYDPVTGVWSACTGCLGVAREKHTATLLGNSTVLVAGGVNAADGILNSCELYDPIAKTWSVAKGALETARYIHTATLLGNGKVLVAGGQGRSGDELDSSELYDPIAGVWSTTGTMGAARFFHTATLLGNGTVLVAGGDNNTNGSLDSCELYDPIAETWSPTGAMGIARVAHTATLLVNGSGMVFVAGGACGGATCELYDPASGNWSATGHFLAARQLHSTTITAHGDVLVEGGQSLSHGLAAVASSELYFLDAVAVP